MITIKVKHLIEKLQELDGEYEVVALSRDNQYSLGKNDAINNSLIKPIVDVDIIKNKCTLLYE